MATKALIGLIIGFCIFSCSERKKKQVLLAENLYRDIINDSLSERVTLFSDSSYIFVKTYKSADTHNTEHKKGKYFIEKDTIHFSRNLLDDTESQKAIIKDNYLEIIDTEACYKIKVVNTQLPNKNTYDKKRFKYYAIFSYHQTRDSSIFRSGRPHELNNLELSLTDSLLRICMEQNPRLRARDNDNYIKQCIATKDSNQEVIVWLNCICHESGLATQDKFKRELLMRVYDGGACYFKVKINLTRRTYDDLAINGEA